MCVIKSTNFNFTELAKFPISFVKNRARIVTQLCHRLLENFNAIPASLGLQMSQI